MKALGETGEGYTEQRGYLHGIVPPLLGVVNSGGNRHCLPMRLRLPELLRARGITAYALAARSGGRISESTAYRLIEMEGCLQTFGADILSALCDVLEVEPGESFERATVQSGRGNSADVTGAKRRSASSKATRRAP